MKHKHQHSNEFEVICVICCVVLFFASCETYNFSQPQPVDEANIYEFPIDFRGSWIDEEDRQTIHIANSYVEMIREGNGKIMPGAWPRLNEKGEYLFTPFGCNSFQTIRYDSARKPIDTITNYFKGKDLVYEINPNGLLETGYPFHIEKDTIMVSRNEISIIDLGRNAFLRKLNERFYVLNIKTSILGEDNKWWQVVIIEKKDNQLLRIWYNTEKLEQDSTMFYHHDGNFYFDSRWSTENMIRLIDEKYFRPGSRLKRADKIAENK